MGQPVALLEVISRDHERAHARFCGGVPAAGRQCGKYLVICYGSAVAGDPVGRRLILDTNILIAYERGTIDRSSLDDDELAIASRPAICSPNPARATATNRDQPA